MQIIFLNIILILIAVTNCYADNIDDLELNSQNTFNLINKVENPLSDEFERDTISTYYDRSSGFRIYQYYDQNQNPRYLTGTNGHFHIIGCKYEFFASNLLGVMIAFAKKQVVEPADTLDILISSGDSIGLPTNPILMSHSILVSSIDTSSSEPLFYPVIFNSPVAINGKIAVMLQVWTQSDESDTVVVFSNSQGDAKGENTSFLSIVQEQGGISSKNFEDFSTNMEDGKKPNFDLMILPIIEYIGTDVQNFSPRQSFSANIFPNPVKEKLMIEIVSDDIIFNTASIVDLNGKIIKKSTFENFSTTKSINVENLQSGVYFLLLSNGSIVYAIKFIKE